MWLDDFHACVAAHPARTAVVSQGQAYTYRELWSRSEAAEAAASRANPGARQWIAHADPLACLEAVIGAWIEGKVPVVVAHDTPAETQRILQQRTALDAPAQEDPERREAMIIGTSGSTSLPKLTVLSRGRFIHGHPPVAAWYSQPSDAQALVAAAIHTTSTLVNLALHGLASGWTLHVFPAGTPGSVLQARIHAHGITVMNGPPSFFRLFLRYGPGATFPSLRHVSAGGETVPRPLLEQMKAAFPAALAYTNYGMTEAGKISVLSMDDPRAAEGGCGVPFPHLETRLAPIDGVAAPAGELCLRGPAVCLGYLQADGGYEGLDAEGFLHTGDVVRPDPDGCLRHLGRRGGLVKVGGLTVNPQEVELTIRTMPEVADVLCWAEPHDLLGYAIAAQVVLQPGADLDDRALRRACREKMERYKVPRSVAIVEQLPEAPSGKRVLKPVTAT